MTNEMPASMADAELDFLGVKVRVHVLDDGRRVIEQADFERVLAILSQCDGAGEDT